MSLTSKKLNFNYDKYYAPALSLEHIDILLDSIIKINTPNIPMLNIILNIAKVGAIFYLIKIRNSYIDIELNKAKQKLIIDVIGDHDDDVQI